MPDEREITLKIAAIAEEIHFARMEGRDEISHPFRYDILFSTDSLDLKPLDVLGTAVVIEVRGDTPRHFHGLATEFGLAEIRDDHAFYRVIARPWLWFLSMKTDNRIFQEKTVPEIVEEVFKSYGGAAFEYRLHGSYKPREYCVQYGESDLDFVHRLMESEGISYFFTHDDGAHKMIVVDGNAAMEPAGGIPALPYEPDSRISFKEGDFITGWKPVTAVRPGAFAQTDYDFTKPSSDLMSKIANPAGHEGDKGENYEYPGHYMDHARGDALSAVRLEALQQPFTLVEAKGTARPLWSGGVFKLDLFPREAENIDHLVLRVDYRLWDEQVRSGQAPGGAPEGYEVSLLLQPYKTVFRPARRTPHPVMRGPQTAVVTGPAGAEIFTDKYSRVKVQFFWDRQGKKDANTTCFIRVSSVWAGSGWGFIQIPRIGQEVIVDFLDGDPDQPIITGRVYNAEQMPPYGLPGDATRSGWKSNSSPGGGGWNELSFEDKKGSEEVYFQAEKDHNELVKNDESRNIGHDFAEDVGHDAQQSIGNDRTESVGHDKAVKVGNNRSVNIGVNDDETVGSNRSLTVGSNESISIGANSTETIAIAHTQTVGAVQTISVGAARVDSVGATETRSVGASQSNTIGTSRSVSVGAGQTHQIGSNDGWTVGGGQTVDIAKDQGVKIGGGQTVQIAKDQATKVGAKRLAEVAADDAMKIGGAMAIDVGKALAITAADSIALVCGSAAITMKKDGTISIEGKDITVKGSGKINLKAGGEITAKGSKINLN